MPGGAGDAVEIGHDWRRKHLSARRRYKEEALPRAELVLGYPAFWPAGPWVVPLFWLTVAMLALLLRAIG